MKILVLAPQPYYIERGTPIAVDLLVKSLSNAGHDVDLLTFSEGEPREYANVRHFRIRPWFSIRILRPGFSVGKLIIDFFFFFRSLALMTKNRYDVVHAVEESAFVAMLLCPVFGTRFVYDMDSSMAEQLVDKLPAPAKPIRPLLEFLESLPMRSSTAVVPVCQALADKVHRYRRGGVFVLKDISLADKETTHDNVLDVRALVGAQATVLMYIGNLEWYQGIDLLLSGFALAAEQRRQAVLVIIGGAESHIAHYRALCESRGINDQVRFTGSQPVSHLFELMQQADILVSPRIHGVNTPMKVYSYMDSGVAVLATELPTHTQVMTSERALLVGDNAQAMADGMVRLIDDPRLRSGLAEKAREYIEREHSLPAFQARLDEIYAFAQSPGPEAG